MSSRGLFQRRLDCILGVFPAVPEAAMSLAPITQSSFNLFELDISEPVVTCGASTENNEYSLQGMINRNILLNLVRQIMGHGKGEIYPRDISESFFPIPVSL